MLCGLIECLFYQHFVSLDCLFSHSNYLHLSARRQDHCQGTFCVLLNLSCRKYSIYCHCLYVGSVSSEVLVPARALVRGHGLVPRVLVEVGRVRRALHLRQDGRREAAGLQAVPVEALQWRRDTIWPEESPA